MRLTIEENPQAIRRYRHMKPARARGTPPCSARCPGNTRSCGLGRGHPGPHIAFGWFGRVLAVWEKNVKEHKMAERARRTVASVQTPPSQEATGSLLVYLRLFRDLVRRRSHILPEVIFLTLALAFAGFAIRWLLLIFGA
jgi:hypothetical protein